MINIIHYKKLIERKKYLTNILDSFEMTYVFNEKYDRDTISKDIIEKYYKNNPQIWEEKTKGLYTIIIGHRELKNSEICNGISHISSLKKISEDINDYGIIIEDDVIFKNYFKNDLFNVMNDIPNDYDIIFLGSEYDIYHLDKLNNSKTIKIKNNIFKKTPPKTRTVDAYIVKKDFAKKLYDNINSLTLPFDFELNYWLDKLNANCYWVDPGLVKQGSMNGVYKSSNR
jgi:GR25 family glycosyltransferase involved in LPS biosynthesis